MKKLLSNTLFWLVLALALGIVLGTVVNEPAMGVILAVRQITGQIIFFLVPLIIIGFIAPSIASISGNASKLLLFTFGLAYLSSEGAAFFALGTSRLIIPSLNIGQAQASTPLPDMLFNLEIPPVMSVMSALVLSIFLGLSVAWVRSEAWTRLLSDFKEMVLLLVKKVMIPVLPFYVATNFCALAYQGMLRQLLIFFLIILFAVIGHFIWLTVLYLSASIYSGRNGWQVIRHYAPAYFTALGTMSSAATLGVALECAHKSDVLDDDTIDFALPLFNNIHLCGSVLTEVFLISAVSIVLYGTLPTIGSMILFVLLLGIFAIGAPGVPGGTVMASLGLVISVIMVPDAAGNLQHFTDAGTSLLITIFALQDSFGTACNITGDGALTLIVNTFKLKKTVTDSHR